MKHGDFPDKRHKTVHTVIAIDGRAGTLTDRISDRISNRISDRISDRICAHLLPGHAGGAGGGARESEQAVHAHTAVSNYLLDEQVYKIGLVKDRAQATQLAFNEK